MIILRGINMKKYYKIIINRILIDFQYRFNIITKIGIRLFQFLIIFFLWSGVYKTSQLSKIGDYNINEMLIYLLITNLITLLFNFSNIHRIGNLVRTGKLTTILLRPISLSLENFFQYLGEKLIIATIFLVVVIFSKIEYKLIAIIYILLLIMMFYYLTSVISSIGFWILQTWSLTGLFYGVYYILAGIYFPLDLLPKYLFDIIKYNPFSLSSYVLAKMLESKLYLNEIMYYVLACIIWIILLKLLYKFALKQGLKIYEGMGA